MKTAAMLTLISLFSTLISAQTDSSNSVKVKVQNGIIEGIKDNTNGLEMFFGIPFAKPPVGELRWKAPQPLDNWDGVRETKKFGPRPVQLHVWDDMHFRSDTMSEDCLYLNVWTPINKEAGNLPVLVYFYGGGFIAGGSSEPRYDGASMAKKGIVVVTVNYRLNVFGFFAYPELSEESPYKGSGNYGLLDQNAGLKWVKNNIAVFGGDPGKITIAGESAGSISVSAQMVSPLSKGLFTGAIGESGAAINPTYSPVPLKEAEKVGEKFAKRSGYLSLKELRALSTQDLLDMYERSKDFRFPLSIDGYFFTKSPVDIFKAGEQAKVPLLVGWNSAESPGYAFTNYPYTVDGYNTNVRDAYPEDYKEILKLYPGNTVKEVETSATDLASDRFIAYSTWKWFDLQRKYSTQPVYRYLFSRIRPQLVDNKTTDAEKDETQSNSNRPKLPDPIGAVHSCEIQYCLGNLYLSMEYGWNDDDFKVSQTMQEYFANFIKTGNPNGSGLPVWTAAKGNDTAPPVMDINVVSKTIKAENDNRYKLLDKIYGNK